MPTIKGTKNADTLIGGHLVADYIFGKDGADTIIGTDGDDVFKGGGADEFERHFVDSFDEVKALMKKINGSAVIAVDRESTVTILNVKVASLSASDFVFSPGI